MTTEEKKVLDLLIQAWNEFVKLPIEHQDDNHEFAHGIHQLQYMVMARATRREINRPIGYKKEYDKEHYWFPYDHVYKTFNLPKFCPSCKSNKGFAVYRLNGVGRCLDCAAFYYPNAK